MPGVPGTPTFDVALQHQRNERKKGGSTSIGFLFVSFVRSYLFTGILTRTQLLVSRGPTAL